MLIPIPIGATHVATVEGAVWKRITCTFCNQPFAFLMELQASGQDLDLLFLDGQGSAERAQTQAEENLLRKSQNIVTPIPCPCCGMFQEEMALRLKDDASINPMQIIGMVVTLLSFVPLAFGVAYLWILTLVGAATGLCILAYGYVIAHRYDPNAGDPEPRRCLAESRRFGASDWLNWILPFK